MAISDTDREDPREETAGNDGTATEDTGAPFAQDAGFEQPPLLGDDEVRLPWLEADDEFEDEREPGTAQGLFLALLGLIAIGLIVGGLIWATRDRPGEQLVADGGVIGAPKEPYKTRPENPGGEVVAGTGDTSFAVAEGQSRQVHIDGADKQDDAPVDVPAPAPTAKPTSTAPAVAPAAPSGGIGVQVGAYSSKETAEAGWNALKVQYPALSGISHRIVEGQADIGKVYRLQAIPGDIAAARALCSGMKGAGLSCQVKN